MDGSYDEKAIAEKILQKLKLENYQMKNLTKEEFVHLLRSQSNGFSRGSQRYRGVTLQKCVQMEAPMGQYLGKKETTTTFYPSNFGMTMPMEVNGASKFIPSSQWTGSLQPTVLQPISNMARCTSCFCNACGTLRRRKH